MAMAGRSSGSKDWSFALSTGHPDDLRGQVMGRGKDKEREILQRPSNTLSPTTPSAPLLTFKFSHPLHTFTPSYITFISPCLSTKSTVYPPLPSLVQATAEPMTRISSKTRTNQERTGMYLIFAYKVQSQSNDSTDIALFEQYFY